MSLAINYGAEAYIRSQFTGGLEDFAWIVPSIVAVVSAYAVAVFGVEPRRGRRGGLRLTWLIPVCIFATIPGHTWLRNALEEHLYPGKSYSYRTSASMLLVPAIITLLLLVVGRFSVSPTLGHRPSRTDGPALERPAEL
ncbi:MAG TPA: hypothetical protein VNA14_06645 [Mycobacteriales bacterium]|nr:hypothetical protein [Mycobacteriales bacterium]